MPHFKTFINSQEAEVDSKNETLYWYYTFSSYPCSLSHALIAETKHLESVWFDLCFCFGPGECIRLWRRQPG